MVGNGICRPAKKVSNIAISKAQIMFNMIPYASLMNARIHDRRFVGLQSKVHASNFPPFPCFIDLLTGPSDLIYSSAYRVRRPTDH